MGHASTRGWAHTVDVSETDTVGSPPRAVSPVTHGTAHTKGSAVTNGSSHTESSGVATFPHKQLRLWRQWRHRWQHRTGWRGAVCQRGRQRQLGILGRRDAQPRYGRFFNALGPLPASRTAFPTAPRKASSNTNSQGHFSRSLGGLDHTSGSETDSVANTTSSSTTQSHSAIPLHPRTQTDGGLGQRRGRGISAGMSVGVAPSFSLSTATSGRMTPTSS